MQRDALKLPGALMQSMATMAPGISVAFTVPFLAATSGLASPLAVFCSAIVSYLLGYSLAQLTRHLRSAGSYGSFTRVLFGPRLAFMVTWVYLLWYPLATAMLCALMGSTLHQLLLANYGWDIPWALPMVLLAALVSALAYVGVKLAVEVVIVLALLEIAVMLTLSVWGLADPGPGGTDVSLLWAGHAPSAHLFFLGFVFSIYNLTGWDNAATLGEETQNPLKNIPRAVLGSISILGIFVVVTTWGQLTGWGTSDLQGFVDSSELPVFVLGHKYWHGAWFIVLIAIANSIVVACLACTNAATRIFFDMGRTGALPRSLGRLSKHKTPGNAILLQTVLNVGIGLLLVVTVGLYNVFSFTGLVFVFALTFVYLIGNLGVWRLYRTTARSEFNVVKHVVIPICGSVALLLVAYESLNPVPPSPLNWALPVVVAWFLLGALVLAVRAARGDNAWLLRQPADDQVQPDGEAVA